MEARRGSSFIPGYFDKPRRLIDRRGGKKPWDFASFVLRGIFILFFFWKIRLGFLSLCHCPGDSSGPIRGCFGLNLSWRGLAWIHRCISLARNTDSWKISHLEFAFLFVLHPGLLGDISEAKGEKKRGTRGGIWRSGYVSKTIPKSFTVTPLCENAKPWTR